VAFLLTSPLLNGLRANSEVYDYGIYFNQYFHDPQVHLHNLTAREQMVFNLIHRRNSNDFGGVNTSIFNFQYHFGKNINKNSSEIGLQLFSDREGALIRRNRMLPYYAKHLRVNKVHKLAAGIGIGFYNFLIKSEGIFEGASDFALDASFFLKFYGDKSSIQLTVNQATNAEVRPVDQSIILGRSFHLFAHYDFILNRHLQIKPSILGRYAKKNSAILQDFTFGAGTQLIVEKKVSVGSTFEYNSGYNFSLGLTDVPILKDFLDLEIAYFVPGAVSERTNVQMFEIILLYKLNKK
jgi:hypothetical protein